MASDDDDDDGNGENLQKEHVSLVSTRSIECTYNKKKMTAIANKMSSYVTNGLCKFCDIKTD